jgi:thiamine pyrophosphokinase
MKRINFKEKKYDALICLNGLITDDYIFSEYRNLPIICADGSANLLYNKQIIPDFIIGDLDSLDEKLFENIIPPENIIFEPDQNSNDFEKVLKFCLTKKYNNLLILGFHGGLLEHSLNNQSVLSRYSKLLNINILENKRIALIISESTEFEVKTCETISLIPQPKCKLTTSGLKWELQNEYLEMGIREGARNESVGNLIKLKIHNGELLVFCDY